ncbi:MAG TPA: sugar phosphate isomerase/epimerase [Clostridiales bacterium]|nr:sugar phosphate isomerase/epimerase [Clostridiales bacterium]
MQLGISTASFFSKYTTEDTFQIISDLGLNVCELFLTTKYEYNPKFIDLIVEKSNLFNIDIYSLHALGTQFEPELFNKVKRTFDDALEYFKLIANAAKKTQAKYYTFHGPMKLKKKTYHLDYQYLGERITLLNNIIKDITLNKCEIAYENVHWTYFDNPNFYTTLRKNCNVSCCLDIKQAFQSKISVYDYIESMKDGLKNIHICDYNDDGELKLPGEGIFDFVSFFEFLYSIQYKGPIILELYAYNYSNINEIGKSLEYLKKCLEIAGKNYK